jgi:hypothetical protein
VRTKGTGFNFFSAMPAYRSNATPHFGFLTWIFALAHGTMRYEQTFSTSLGFFELFDRNSNYPLGYPKNNSRDDKTQQSTQQLIFLCMHCPKTYRSKDNAGKEVLRGLGAINGEHYECK